MTSSAIPKTTASTRKRFQSTTDAGGASFRREKSLRKLRSATYWAWSSAPFRVRRDMNRASTAMSATADHRQHQPEVDLRSERSDPADGHHGRREHEQPDLPPAARGIEQPELLGLAQWRHPSTPGSPRRTTWGCPSRTSLMSSRRTGPPSPISSKRMRASVASSPVSSMPAPPELSKARMSCCPCRRRTPRSSRRRVPCG